MRVNEKITWPAYVCVFLVLMTSEVERWMTVMERFKGGRENGDEWGEETGEEDNTVQPMFDDLRNEGRGRHHQTTEREGEIE